MLIVGFVLACCFGAFQLSGFLADRELAAQKARADAANRNMAMMLTESVNNAFRQADILLRLLKAEWESNGSIPRAYSNFLAETLNAGMINRISVTDAAGNIVFSAVNLPEPLNIASHEHFQQHRSGDGGTVLVNSLLTGNLGGSPTVFVSRRLNDASGSFNGIVSVGIRQEYLLRVFREMELSGDNTLTLLHTDGRILARIPGEFDREAFATVFRNHPTLRRVRTGEMAGQYEVPGADGIPRLGAFRKFADYPVIALATTTKAAVFFRDGPAPGFVFLVGAAIFSVVMALAGFLIWLQLRKQFRTEQVLLSREKDLTYASYHDALTGIHSRGYFYEKARQAGPRAGIIMADLDGLKAINDTHGHQVGDRALVAAAAIILRCAPQGTVTARIGGDEFVVFLPEATETGVKAIISSARKDVSRYNSGNDLPLRVSFGYSVAEGIQLPLEELMATADKWMYRDKQRQGGTHRGQFTNTLRRMLVARDYITEGHVSRVTETTIALAKAAGLPSAQIPDLELFAYFHDIGKVGISDSILNKPGPLTENEHHQMQHHSAIGHQIASATDELAVIADWILKHHERWDGKGYPLGLAGEAIPIQCRILAIADAYDAMTSDRPYRRAMSDAAARQELLRNAGTQFDPDLVDKFARSPERVGTAGIPDGETKEIRR